MKIDSATLWCCKPPVASWTSYGIRTFGVSLWKSHVWI